jgi:hypothetical protein
MQTGNELLSDGGMSGIGLIKKAEEARSIQEELEGSKVAEDTPAQWPPAIGSLAPLNLPSQPADDAARLCLNALGVVATRLSRREQVWERIA